MLLEYPKEEWEGGNILKRSNSRNITKFDENYKHTDQLIPKHKKHEENSMNTHHNQTAYH